MDTLILRIHHTCDENNDFPFDVTVAPTIFFTGPSDFVLIIKLNIILYTLIQCMLLHVLKIYNGWGDLTNVPALTKTLVPYVQVIPDEIVAVDITSFDSNGHTSASTPVPMTGSVPAEMPFASGDVTNREQSSARLLSTANAEARLARHVEAQDTLEKENKQLRWQIAMLSGQGGAAPMRMISRQGWQVEDRLRSLARMSGSERVTVGLGYILKHRVWFVAGYLVLLHWIVYFALTHGMLTHRCADEVSHSVHLSRISPTTDRSKAV